MDVLTLTDTKKSVQGLEVVLVRNAHSRRVEVKGPTNPVNLSPKNSLDPSLAAGDGGRVKLVQTRFYFKGGLYHKMYLGVTKGPSPDRLVRLVPDR